MEEKKRKAQHEAEEKKRYIKRAEQESWLRVHMDTHMKHILDPEGPLKYCSASQGHRGLLKPLVELTHPIGGRNWPTTPRKLF
jgi:hypothetical protein